uniref:AMP-binding protein n=1 Tax=Allokutzneria albata TaxID=211114 RepID=UPI00200CFBD3
ERQQLAEWNSTRVDFPGATLPELFEAQAAATPDAIAVVRVLLERGAGPERIVAVSLPRSVESIVALFAVLKAGAIYLPLDSDLPAARMEYILSDAKPHVVVREVPLGADPVNLAPLSRVDSGAYAIYTSGAADGGRT